MSTLISRRFGVNGRRCGILKLDQVRSVDTVALVFDVPPPIVGAFYSSMKAWVSATVGCLQNVN
jgi:50S ribosomal subunit-associated GTPase HflX